MKVIPLKNDRLYSCYAYLLLGNWNRLEDVNTLVDVGANGFVLEMIEPINTGVGKTPVEQVILTHGHFDHAGGLPAVKARYNPRIFAYTHNNGGSEKLKDGQALRAGDRELEVMHMPVHSQDSICLYCGSEGVLFSGDTPLRIMTPGGTYPASFLMALEILVKLKINRIYSGHDGLIQNAASMLKATFNNVQRSTVIDK
jgi:glyoxylase-like metal-dependent hydrolase (beta-lactamase superfamily II)